ncbi:MAG: MarR family transcriptional regulator [Chloroflexi bacterium]|nr:MAG: MarR family transcriptional regulator [Chloroflexota bacterium]TMF35323.1 MAG: MarR family transcriptional regulator [Chloroflexota bacterium]
MELPFISPRTNRAKLPAMADQFVPGLRYRSSAQELWALLIEAFAGWEERINEAAAAAGLSPVSAWVLVQLDPEHAISQKELAARLRCNPSTVVDPTDRLEENGLVIRRPQPTDRRINILTVTRKGRQVRQTLVRRLFEPPEAFRRLPAADQDRFRDAMLTAVGRVKTRPKS